MTEIEGIVLRSEIEPNDHESQWNRLYLVILTQSNNGPSLDKVKIIQGETKL